MKRERFAERALAAMAEWRESVTLDRIGGAGARHRRDRRRRERRPAVTTDVARLSRSPRRRSATSRRTRSAPTSATSREFVAFPRPLLRRRGDWTWQGVDRLAMRGFLGHLARARTLAKRSMARTLSAVRSFYRYLHRNEIVDTNPARAVGAPKLEKYLPAYLDRAQIDLLFQMAEVRAWEGRFVDVRNLAILELFYSTGMRLSELQGLSRGDLDMVTQQVKVRGKGRKERIVPVGNHAILALRNYEAKRDELLRVGRVAKATGARSFSRETGERIGVRAVQKVVTRLSQARSTRTPGCPFTRCATRSPRTCWTRAPTCGPCRSSSATHRSRRRRSTRTRASSGSSRSTRRPTRAREAARTGGRSPRRPR